MKRFVFVIALLVSIPQLAGAVITFEQLDENTFSISHQVKGFGGRGQAMELVYEKAASLCIAAGYTHMQILDQASHAGGGWEAPNATVTVKFFLDDADDRVSCEMKASQDYINQATKKLQKRGYKGPEVDAAAPDPAPQPVSPPSSCTVEQIAAMVKAGMTDAQIKAACEVKE